MNLKDNGTWTSSDNTVFFKFDAKMDNGDSGSFLAKSNPPLQKVGEEYEYTIEEKNGHKNIKWAKPSGGGFQPKQQRDPAEEARRQAMIVRQSSVKVAADLVGYGKVQYDDLLIVAQRITDWAIGDAKADKMNSSTNELPPF